MNRFFRPDCCLFTLLFLALSCRPYAQSAERASVWADSVLTRMNSDEKIGQLIMVTAFSDKTADYENQLEKTICRYNIGGIVFLQGDAIAQARMTNRYQKVSKHPLMIGISTEEGLGGNLQSAMTFPSLSILNAIDNDPLLYQLGAAVARQCKKIGVHVNFIPVSEDDPYAIPLYALGESQVEAGRKMQAYEQGSLSEQVLPVNSNLLKQSDFIISRTALKTGRSYYAPNNFPSTPGMLPAESNNTPGIPADEKTAGTPANFPSPLTPDNEKTRGEAQEIKNRINNGILLTPEHVGPVVEKIKKSLVNGTIQEKEIDEKCREILKAKYLYVLPNTKPLRTDGLWSRLNTAEDVALKYNLYKNAVTLVKNWNNLIPLRHLDSLHIASINFGGKAANNFQTLLGKYAPVTNLQAETDLSDVEITALVKQLASYNCVIIYNSAASGKASENFGYSERLEKLITRLSGKKIIFCHPGTPYGLPKYINLPVDAVVISYEDNPYMQQFAAQAMFGGIDITGQLPVTINSNYPARTSIQCRKTRLGYATPEMCQASSQLLSGIDSLCKQAIQTQATPGCQVLVAKNGYIIYNKAFGYNTYNRKVPNNTSNIYDVASITKIVSTLPAIMKLCEEGKLNLDKPLSNYYTALQNTNKKEITVKEVLCHNAGLKAYIPFLANAIDQKALPGPLFSTRPNKNNSFKLTNNLYINPSYHFKDSCISNIPRPGYDSLNPGIYIASCYRENILATILDSDLNPKKGYVYSDLGFILLKFAVEEVAHKGIDDFCKEQFFRKLGTTNTDYVAALRLNEANTVPSSIDNLYRKKELRGFVHDPTAALLGGIAGHAGIFSTAEDLAKIMAMYLGNGNYGGEQFLAPETIARFTNRNDCFNDNRRGLGFDKPEMTPGKIGPTSKEAPASSFGHTGFTGTMTWCDPDNQLIYIFLSNRTYPSEFNTKLTEESIRTKIQSVIYKAVGK